MLCHFPSFAFLLHRIFAITENRRQRRWQAYRGMSRARIRARKVNESGGSKLCNAITTGQKSIAKAEDFQDLRNRFVPWARATV